MKNTAINQIMNQIATTEQELEMHQAIVNSLTEKKETAQLYLQIAEANKTQALANKNSMEDLVQSALNVMNSTESTEKDILNTRLKAVKITKDIKNTLDQLIYSAEIINKLSVTIIKKKALNPLISDELISRVHQSTKDCNTAIALTIIALKSTFSAQSAASQTASTITLAQKHATALYLTLTGTMISDDKTIIHETPSNPAKTQLENAYEIAVLYFENALTSNAETMQQLNVALSNLNKTEQKLKSLQSGLAAYQQV
jgi:hypothetical protein